MRIFAVDNGREISVDEFFANHGVIFDNEFGLATARLLKTLMRNIKKVDVLANAVDDGYELELSDKNRVYYLRFKIRKGAIELLDLK